MKKTIRSDHYQNEKEIMTESNDLCPLCGGKKTNGTTTFSADLGSGVVVVRQVRATVCAQCGEEWIDNATALQLEEIVNDARKHGLQVGVAEMKWLEENENAPNPK